MARKPKPGVNEATRQRGVVMVVVLSVVVLMVTLMALLIEEQHLFIRQVSNQRVSEQGFQYAQGLNAWAARVLHEDPLRTSDHLQEKWAKFGRPSQVEEDLDEFSLDLSSQRGRKDEDPEPVVKFDIDSYEVSIDDLQARYNLNNLIKDGKVDPKQKIVFINLLELIGVADYDQREKMYASLVDWLDDNDATQPNGAESGIYRSKSTPYHAADQMATGLGELRFVDGFDRDTIRSLRPYVTLLPINQAKININTASPEVVAATSSAPVTDLGAVIAFLQKREQPGFQGFQVNQLQQATAAVIRSSATRRSPVANMLQVTSQFFQINTKVELGDSVVCTRTVVLRENANPKVLSEPKVRLLSQEQDTLCVEDSANQGVTTKESDDDLS